MTAFRAYFSLCSGAGRGGLGGWGGLGGGWGAGVELHPSRARFFYLQLTFSDSATNRFSNDKKSSACVGFRSIGNIVARNQVFGALALACAWFRMISHCPLSLFFHSLLVAQHGTNDGTLQQRSVPILLCVRAGGGGGGGLSAAHIQRLPLANRFSNEKKSTNSSACVGFRSIVEAQCVRKARAWRANVENQKLILFAEERLRALNPKL